MNRRKPGQSIMEYALIMGIVAVVCIPGLMMLKDSINGSISGMLAPSAAQSSKSNVAKQIAIQTGMPAMQASTTAFAASVNAQDSSVPIGSSQNANIQVSGANGDMQTVYANSATMLELAAQFEQSNPKVSNALIELGQLGQKMALSMANGNKDATEKIWDQFTDLYGTFYEDSQGYGKLSAADQALVSNLTNQSVKLTADFIDIGYGSYTGLNDSRLSPATDKKDAAKQVNSNSVQTEQCGENLKCN